MPPSVSSFSSSQWETAVLFQFFVKSKELRIQAVLRGHLAEVSSGSWTKSSLPESILQAASLYFTGQQMKADCLHLSRAPIAND